ncbi:hypothetical protein BJ742DRAFT_872428 [Cladochytrium replicatum]|nr:hypothetical protein BJ742DRAFT_872428 [Cladochytrium replicatum]
MDAPNVPQADELNGPSFGLKLGPCTPAPTMMSMANPANMIDGAALFSVLSAAFVVDPTPTTLALLQHVGGLLQQSRTNQNNFLEQKISESNCPLNPGQPLQAFFDQPTNASLANCNGGATVSKETTTDQTFNFSSTSFSDQTATNSGGWIDTTETDVYADNSFDAQLMDSIFLSINDESKDNFSSLNYEGPMIATKHGESSSVTPQQAQCEARQLPLNKHLESMLFSSEQEYQLASSEDPEDFGWLEQISALANLKPSDEEAFTLPSASDHELGNELDWGILQLMMGPLVDQTNVGMESIPHHPSVTLNVGAPSIEHTSSHSCARNDNTTLEEVVGSVGQSLHTVPEPPATNKTDFFILHSMDDNAPAKNGSLPNTNPEVSKKKGYWVKFGSRPEIESLYDEYLSAVEPPEQAMPPTRKSYWSFGAEGGFTVDQMNILRKQLDQYLQLMIQTYAVTKEVFGADHSDTKECATELRWWVDTYNFSRQSLGRENNPIETMGGGASKKVIRLRDREGIKARALSKIETILTLENKPKSRASGHFRKEYKKEPKARGGTGGSKNGLKRLNIDNVTRHPSREEGELSEEDGDWVPSNPQDAMIEQLNESVGERQQEDGQDETLAFGREAQSKHVNFVGEGDDSDNDGAHLELTNYLKKVLRVCRPFFDVDLLPRITKVSKNRTRFFLDAEDKLLLIGLQSYGSNLVESIRAHCLPARKATQISRRLEYLSERKRPQNDVKTFHLQPFKPFTLQERDLLREGVRCFGKSFKSCVCAVFKNQPRPIIFATWRSLAIAKEVNIQPGRFHVKPVGKREGLELGGPNQRSMVDMGERESVVAISAIGRTSQPAAPLCVPECDNYNEARELTSEIDQLLSEELELQLLTSEGIEQKVGKAPMPADVVFGRTSRKENESPSKKGKKQLHPVSFTSDLDLDFLPPDESKDRTNTKRLVNKRGVRSSFSEPVDLLSRNVQTLLSSVNKEPDTSRTASGIKRKWVFYDVEKKEAAKVARAQKKVTEGEGVLSSNMSVVACSTLEHSSSANSTALAAVGRTLVTTYVEELHPTAEMLNLSKKGIRKEMVPQSRSFTKMPSDQTDAVFPIGVEMSPKKRTFKPGRNCDAGNCNMEVIRSGSSTHSQIMRPSLDFENVFLDLSLAAPHPTDPKRVKRNSFEQKGSEPKKLRTSPSTVARSSTPRRRSSVANLDTQQRPVLATMQSWNVSPSRIRNDSNISSSCTFLSSSPSRTLSPSSKNRSGLSAIRTPNRARIIQHKENDDNPFAMSLNQNSSAHGRSSAASHVVNRGNSDMFPR